VDVIPYGASVNAPPPSETREFASHAKNIPCCLMHITMQLCMQLLAFYSGNKC